MHHIKQISAYEILDSRSWPTIEAEIILADGSRGRFAVPAGLSTGSHEACELRDGDQHRYWGKGVTQVISRLLGEVSQQLIGQSFDQASLDDCLINLDGTSDKSRLGANGLLSLSGAFARAVADSQKIFLFQYLNSLMGESIKPEWPIPMFNILNGGAHALNSTDIQEFMIMPIGASTISEAVRYGVETFQALKKILLSNDYSVLVGDEGGFAPNLTSNHEALELILEAIQKAGYIPGTDIVLAIDAAANNFYDQGIYHWRQGNHTWTAEELITEYKSWVDRYPLRVIEDGLAEDDWAGQKLLSDELGQQIQLIGDDLFVTNQHRLQQGIDQGVANAILLKMNQVGTISETLATAKLARQAGYDLVASHRSGETEDNFLADLALGLPTKQLKAGSLCRSERLSKYNQLLRLEKIFPNEFAYAGRNFQVKK